MAKQNLAQNTYPMPTMNNIQEHAQFKMPIQNKPRIDFPGQGPKTISKGDLNPYMSAAKNIAQNLDSQDYKEQQMRREMDHEMATVHRYTSKPLTGGTNLFFVNPRLKAPNSWQATQDEYWNRNK